YSLGEAPPLPELSPGCPLVEAVRHGTLQARPKSPDEPCQRQLRLLGGEVAHGLSHEGQLLALLILGPRDAGAYRAEDVNVLAAFAQVTVLALTSAEGRQAVDVLNRELQDKVEKIAEQQRRILALQKKVSELGTRNSELGAKNSSEFPIPSSPLE